MFGGRGIYVESMIVARGLEPFRYAKKSGQVEVTSYYRPPDEALESPDAMRD
jgi:TfoX/Sxy family transcriptional regulator of competence genes